MGIIEKNTELMRDLAAATELATESGARVDELSAKLKAEIENTGILRVQIAAHEATIEALRSDVEQANAALAGANEAVAQRDVDLAIAKAGSKSVAAGVAVELQKLGVDPIDQSTADQSGPTWAERFAEETDPKKRAKIWHEHRDDILDGK